ncbi:uncharacterized protein LOC131159537 isoform X2 [Malania oleifera]|uniref:uncharacterized protein LOC131159537 isoform X2 n=1 Tax=Malania oleifera TaxID=397392 RepID=UPI0025AE6EDD|nr:uncharacterized protein LOC131159537 isoform X2 [Malania oleifera]XP_057970524.1 uncharacterized protein LOC131159537 isoform X2 [Malania oleifera]XP_057970526.1 uncharacterized protein LOC131159537 isoform X2 [Malania oleifera]
MGDVTAALDSSSSSFKTPICDKPLILTIEGKGSGQALKLSFEGLEISMTLLKQSAPSFQKLSISDASEKGVYMMVAQRSLLSFYWYVFGFSDPIAKMLIFLLLSKKCSPSFLKD